MFCRVFPAGNAWNRDISRAPVDPRSDVYGCGLLLYEVTTGERIFMADDLRDLLREIEQGPKRAISDVTQTLPRGFVEVLYRAMAVDPEQRYQDLVQSCPSIPQRVPQHMMASYLGITAETLSRIRRQLALRK